MTKMSADADNHLITAASCKRAARMFNYLSIGSSVLSAALFGLGKMVGGKISFLPLAMSMPPVAVWLAASIFVYASIAHHPNLTVRHYNQWAGYRYYALLGTLPVVPIFHDFIPGGWGSIAVLLLGILLPWAGYDIWRAGREDWQDMVVDLKDHR